MPPDITVQAPVTSPVRVEPFSRGGRRAGDCPQSCSFGCPLGADLRRRYRFVGDQLRQDLYQRGSARCLGRRLRFEQGHECTLRPSSSAPDRGWLHGVQDLHDAYGPRCGMGAPDQHEVAPWRRGRRPLGPPARGPDHAPPRRRPGHRRPRSRSPHPLGHDRHHHRLVGPGLDCTDQWGFFAVLRPGHGGNGGHVPRRRGRHQPAGGHPPPGRLLWSGLPRGELCPPPRRRCRSGLPLADLGLPVGLGRGAPTSHLAATPGLSADHGLQHLARCWRCCPRGPA